MTAWSSLFARCLLLAIMLPDADGGGDQHQHLVDQYGHGAVGNAIGQHTTGNGEDHEPGNFRLSHPIQEAQPALTFSDTWNIMKPKGVKCYVETENQSFHRK